MEQEIEYINHENNTQNWISQEEALEKFPVLKGETKGGIYAITMFSDVLRVDYHYRSSVVWKWSGYSWVSPVIIGS